MNGGVPGFPFFKKKIRPSGDEETQLGGPPETIFLFSLALAVLGQGRGRVAKLSESS